MTNPKLTLPSQTDFELLREGYADHMAKCAELLEALPPRKRMRRTNAGFHHDASAVAGFLATADTKAPRLLEVGVWKGATLSYSLQTAGEQAQATGLDIFQFRHQDTEALHVIASQGMRDRVKLHKSPSQDIPRAILKQGPVFDVVHIDGSHQYDDAVRDILIYSNFCKPGGWVIIDDYLDEEFSPEVRPAVDFLCELGFITSVNRGVIDGFSNFCIQKTQSGRL
ncbi:Methyltransferase domain-containing protein [Monaibacterium marinum]|uniref:Methyltransferase domain-containing protein n=1 Tax=Pontivivens marinum TaxID=1690039 RepID=A0A2C9CW56_9RHOB|nr:class I SAM-dependent methyltransferase [Monaibacterium marinum]SOH95498.1 Methyltransferase domain-containing protein [Monaibacterium marinum]